MNELVKAGNNALAAASALKGNLQKAKMAIPQSTNMTYLRYLQDGSWVFGQENDEILPEDKIAVNPMSIKTGWSCWTDRPGKGAKNENLGEVMVPLGHDAVAKSDLPKKTDPDNGDVCEWREQVSVDVKVLTGPHKGKEVHYRTTSVGGASALNALIDQIILQVDEDPANIVPVVSLDGEHYNHKKYGRTYTPKIVIKSWMTMDGVAPEADAEDDGAEDQTDERPDEQDDEPEEQTTSRRRAREPEPEAVDEPQADDAPRRRRRR